MENQDVKKLILDYLQLHAWDLTSKIAELNELKFEEDPPRLVLCMTREVDDLPKIEFMGQPIPVEIRVTGEPVVLTHDKEQLPTPEKHPTVKEDGLYHHNVEGSEEALGPFPKAGNKNERVSKAMEEWKKRWPGVGVKKDDEE